jgi:hypothetical protein
VSAFKKFIILAKISATQKEATALSSPGIKALMRIKAFKIMLKSRNIRKK